MPERTINLVIPQKDSSDQKPICIQRGWMLNQRLPLTGEKTILLEGSLKKNAERELPYIANLLYGDGQEPGTRHDFPNERQASKLSIRSVYLGEPKVGNVPSFTTDPHDYEHVGFPASVTNLGAKLGAEPDDELVLVQSGPSESCTNKVCYVLSIKREGADCAQFGAEYSKPAILTRTASGKTTKDGNKTKLDVPCCGQTVCVGKYDGIEATTEVQDVTWVMGGKLAIVLLAPLRENSTRHICRKIENDSRWVELERFKKPPPSDIVVPKNPNLSSEPESSDVEGSD